jgi:hypothetical protein
VKISLKGVRKGKYTYGPFTVTQIGGPGTPWTVERDGHETVLVRSKKEASKVIGDEMESWFKKSREVGMAKKNGGEK